MEYNANSISSLKFPLNVQKRVGMYLGSRDIKGKMHTIEEILANSIDEFAANIDTGGYGKVIDIKIHKMKFENKEYDAITIKDRGRGIPIDIHPEAKIPALTYILTTLHAGGKIDKNGGYVASGGLNGVGASAVLATARYFRAIVARDNRVVMQEFAYGYPINEMHDIKPKDIGCKDKNKWLIVENFNNEVDIEQLQKENPDKCVIERGTTITWITWDKENEEDLSGIFEPNLNWDIEQIKNRLDELTYLNPGLKLRLNLYDKEIYEFIHEEGLKNYFYDKLNFETLKEKILLKPMYFKTKIDNGLKPEDQKYKFVTIDTSFFLGLIENKITKYYVNNIPVIGGTQEQGIKEGIKNALINIALREKLIKSEKNISDKTINSIFNVIMNIRIENPDFRGQTKEKLSNPEARTLIRNFIQEEMEKYFLQNLETLKNIVKTIETLKKLQDKEMQIFDKLLKEKTGKKAQIDLASKLADCRNKKSKGTELFICEGDSAMGPIKNSRNSDFQAVLPMKGKPLNALNVEDTAKLLKNNEIASIITALQCGIGNKFDISKLRYERIIILSDADEDGAHITSLLLTFFYKFYPELIENGKLFVALSPLYEALNIKTKEKKYIYNKEELNEFLVDIASQKYPKYSLKKLEKVIKTKLQSNENNFFDWVLKRNKGLGEMSPKAMWESTLNPKTRKLIKVDIENSPEELEKIKVYMDDKKQYVEKRKAIFVKNI